MRNTHLGTYQVCFFQFSGNPSNNKRSKTEETPQEAVPDIAKTETTCP